MEILIIFMCIVLIGIGLSTVAQMRVQARLEREEKKRVAELAEKIEDERLREEASYNLATVYMTKELSDKMLDELSNMRAARLFKTSPELDDEIVFGFLVKLQQSVEHNYDMFKNMTYKVFMDVVREYTIQCYPEVIKLDSGYAYKVGKLNPSIYRDPIEALERAAWINIFSLKSKLLEEYGD